MNTKVQKEQKKLIVKKKYTRTFLFFFQIEGKIIQTKRQFVQNFFYNVQQELFCTYCLAQIANLPR